MIKRIEITIEGTTPLLMHKFSMEQIEGQSKMTAEQQCEIAAYRMPDTKELFVPGVNIQRCFVKGGAFVKGKGRATLQKTVAACVMITPENVLLGTKHFQIDSRSVVIAATKGRIIRHRPRLDNWKLVFYLEFDDVLLSMKELRSVVDNAGLRCGLGDFRPEKGGYFGRFTVVSWKD